MLWDFFSAQGDALEVLRYELEVDTRTQLVPRVEFLEVKVMPSLGVTVRKDMSLWFAYARVQQFQPGDHSENRIQQEYLFDRVTDPLRVVLRARFEERWFAGNNNPSVRFRALVRAGVQLGYEHLRLQAQGEMIFTLLATPGITTQGFEEARAWLGLQLRLPNLITWGLGYLAQYQSNGTFTNNMVTQVVFHLPTSLDGDRALPED